MCSRGSNQGVGNAMYLFKSIQHILYSYPYTRAIRIQIKHVSRILHKDVVFVSCLNAICRVGTFLKPNKGGGFIKGWSIKRRVGKIFDWILSSICMLPNWNTRSTRKTVTFSSFNTTFHKNPSCNLPLKPRDMRSLFLVILRFTLSNYYLYQTSSKELQRTLMPLQQILWFWLSL